MSATSTLHGAAGAALTHAVAAIKLGLTSLRFTSTAKLPTSQASTPGAAKCSECGHDAVIVGEVALSVCEACAW